ncbi:MAG TPA: outer membrane beta-barrel protein [Steroidobacteraceae bacterium]
MNNRSSRSRISLRAGVAVAGLIACSLGATKVAQADDLLGLYVGAAYGQAHIRAQLGGLIPGSTASLPDFDQTHSAYQAMVGIRPISFLGAEVTYMDLGQSAIRGSGGVVPGGLGSLVTGEQVSQKGEALFGLLYLPIPIIDVYVKAGLSRITTNMNATYVTGGVVPICANDQPNCNILSAARGTTDVNFAYGAGLQWKLGPWAVRGEYERFDAAGANPSLLSIGMTYWIP